MTIKNVAIIGCGRVGRVFARALPAVGYDLRGVVTRQRDQADELTRTGIAGFRRVADLPSEVDFLLICVGDGQIVETRSDVIARGGFHEGTVIAHTAGALSAELLDPVREIGGLPLAFHPMQTFTGGEGPEVFRGVTFGVDGDEAAVECGKSIARRLGGTAVVIPSAYRIQYHIACVFAGNFIASLLYAGIDLLAKSGMDEGQALQALAPLARQSAANIASLGSPDAITGPVARGDVETLGMHSKALEDNPELRGIYLALSRVMARKLALSKERESALLRALEGD